MPAMRPRHFHLGSQNGFTLVEIIIVVVVLGVMSAYAVMKGMPVAEVTLPSQAQKMASDIRQAQTLAYTTGKRMRLTIATGPNGTYSVACRTPTPPATSCATDFSVDVQKGVALCGVVTTGDGTLNFNSWGQPLDSLDASTSVSYTIKTATACSVSTINMVTISVAALTGNVTVSP